MKSIFVPKALSKSDSPACVDVQYGSSSTDMHWHSCAEIIHMRQGEALIFASERWETLNEGDTVFLPPGHLHCCHCTDENASRVVIGLEKVLIPQISTQNDVSHAPFYSKALHNKLIFKKSPTLVKLFEGLADISRDSTAHGELLRLITVERIFCEMISVWEHSGLLNLTEKRSETVRKIQGIIAEEFATPITAAEVAKRMNISYSYMATLLSRELNTSFGELLLSERIGAAKRLLLTTNMSITEIALDAGFTDASYFIKKFRAFTGTTPYKYRMENLKRIHI